MRTGTNNNEDEDDDNDNDDLSYDGSIITSQLVTMQAGDMGESFRSINSNNSNSSSGTASPTTATATAATPIKKTRRSLASPNRKANSTSTNMSKNTTTSPTKKFFLGNNPSQQQQQQQQRSPRRILGRRSRSLSPQQKLLKKNEHENSSSRNVRVVTSNSREEYVEEEEYTTMNTKRPTSAGGGLQKTTTTTTEVSFPFYPSKTNTNQQDSDVKSIDTRLIPDDQIFEEFDDDDEEEEEEEEEEFNNVERLSAIVWKRKSGISGKIKSGYAQASEKAATFTSNFKLNNKKNQESVSGENVDHPSWERRRIILDGRLLLYYDKDAEVGDDYNNNNTTTTDNNQQSDAGIVNTDTVSLPLLKGSNGQQPLPPQDNNTSSSSPTTTSCIPFSNPPTTYCSPSLPTIPRLIKKFSLIDQAKHKTAIDTPRGVIDIVNRHTVVSASSPRFNTTPTPFALSITSKSEPKWMLCFENHKELLKWLNTLANLSMRRNLSFKTLNIKQNKSEDVCIGASDKWWLLPPPPKRSISEGASNSTPPPPPPPPTPTSSRNTRNTATLIRNYSSSTSSTSSSLNNNATSTNKNELIRVVEEQEEVVNERQLGGAGGTKNSLAVESTYASSTSSTKVTTQPTPPAFSPIIVSKSILIQLVILINISFLYIVFLALMGQKMIMSYLYVAFVVNAGGFFILNTCERDDYNDETTNSIRYYNKRNNKSQKQQQLLPSLVASDNTTAVQPYTDNKRKILLKNLPSETNDIRNRTFSSGSIKYPFKPLAGASTIHLDDPHSSNLNKGNDPMVAWFPSCVSNTQTRGVDYLTTKKKIPCPASLYELIKVDAYEAEEEMLEIGQQMNISQITSLSCNDDEGIYNKVFDTTSTTCNASTKTWKAPDTFIVALTLPTSAPKIGRPNSDRKGYVTTGYYRMRKVTRSILRVVTHPNYNPDKHDEKLRNALVDENQKIMINGVKLFEDWCRKAPTDHSMQKRFKFIAKGDNLREVGCPSWICKYNGKPILIKRPGVTGFLYSYDNVMEFDLSLMPFPYLFKSAMVYLKEHLFPKMLMTFSFLIEGRSEDELPEILIGNGLQLCFVNPKHVSMAKDVFEGTAPKSF